MDAPVVGALITAGVALVVAVGNGVRNAARTSAERRYERRHTFLIAAQDAMLALRQALATYGVALQEQVDTDTSAPVSVQGTGVLLPGAPMPTSFVLRVPAAVDLNVDTTRAALAVARSRLEDVDVDAALGRWEAVAQASKIDPHDTQTAAEEEAFAEVNQLIRVALRR